MNFDTAKKAIDYFLSHSSKSLSRSITFYGGEPLLEFPLIKRCVSYANERSKEKIHYGITTNGKLLSDEIIRFLKNNHITPSISLDGPRKTHNRYRKFISGKNSYDIIIKNVERLKKSNKDSPSPMVNFNITIAPPYRLLETMNYFDALSKHINCFLTPYHVATYESDLFMTQRELFKKDLKYQFKQLRQEFKNCLVNQEENRSPFLTALFSKSLRRICNRGHFNKFEHYHYPNGTCFPGWERFFVNSYGEFFICEKMTDFYTIGNVEKGLDYDTIFRIFDEYCNICEQCGCSNCWAVRLCSLCFLSAKRDKKFDLDKRRSACKYIKNNLEKDIAFFLEVREENPDAFSYFDREVTYDYMRNEFVSGTNKKKEETNVREVPISRDNC